MVNENISKDFSFKRSAIYKIIVQGEVQQYWSERLGDMQISVNKNAQQKTISTLVGKIPDQTALSSILNTLYELHLTVISVNMLDEIED
jgi:hypothetical protein